MAELNIDGRIKVKNLKENFKQTFGTTYAFTQQLSERRLQKMRLRWHQFVRRALKVEIFCERKYESCTFEKKVAELYSIGVQVSSRIQKIPCTLKIEEQNL